MTPPAMDKFLISTFLGMNWPESPLEPKQENRKFFEVKYPGLVRELDLFREDIDVQHVLKSIIFALDKLHFINPAGG